MQEILDLYSPSRIEYPGYSPHTTSGKDFLKIIKTYKRNKKLNIEEIKVTPSYISSLDKAQNYGYRDTLHHPKIFDNDSANNNSTVKHFRSGSFNVLSLGDVESPNIASGLRRQRTIYQETDVMILAHHGADNGFTTSSFIRAVRPSVAIATTDYANQYEHPKQKIRDLLHKNNVRLFTTKTGDVLIYSIGSLTGKYKVVNLKSGSSEVSSNCEFYANKANF